MFLDIFRCQQLWRTFQWHLYNTLCDIFRNIITAYSFFLKKKKKTLKIIPQMKESTLSVSQVDILWPIRWTYWFMFWGGKVLNNINIYSKKIHKYVLGILGLFEWWTHWWFNFIYKIIVFVYFFFTNHSICILIKKFRKVHTKQW